MKSKTSHKFKKRHKRVNAIAGMRNIFDFSVKAFQQHCILININKTIGPNTFSRECLFMVNWVTYNCKILLLLTKNCDEKFTENLNRIAGDTVYYPWVTTSNATFEQLLGMTNLYPVPKMLKGDDWQSFINATLVCSISVPTSVFKYQTCSWTISFPRPLSSLILTLISAIIAVLINRKVFCPSKSLTLTAHIRVVDYLQRNEKDSVPQASY